MQSRSLPGEGGRPGGRCWPAAASRPSARAWGIRECYLALYRRRMYTEEKAKVVADVWGTEFIYFLAVLAIEY